MTSFRGCKNHDQGCFASLSIAATHLCALLLLGLLPPDLQELPPLAHLRAAPHHSAQLTLQSSQQLPTNNCSTAADRVIPQYRPGSCYHSKWRTAQRTCHRQSGSGFRIVCHLAAALLLGRQRCDLVLAQDIALVLRVPPRLQISRTLSGKCKHLQHPSSCSSHYSMLWGSLTGKHTGKMQQSQCPVVRLTAHRVTVQGTGQTRWG